MDLSKLSEAELDAIVAQAKTTKKALRERQLKHLREQVADIAVEAQRLGVTLLGLLREAQREQASAHD